MLIIAFSLFSYYFIERNFLKLRESAEKNIFPKQPQKTALQTNS